MTKISRKPTQKQWDDAADDYEIGWKPAAQIARELGVSPSTVSREFKRRDLVKARRVAESIAPLVAALDARDRAQARQREEEEAANDAQGVAIERMILGMIRGLVAADRAGNLAAAGPAITTIRKSLGAKPL